MSLSTNPATSQQRVTPPVEQTTEKPAISQSKSQFCQLSTKIDRDGRSMTQTYPSANRQVEEGSKADRVYTSKDMKNIGAFVSCFYNFVNNNTVWQDRVGGKLNATLNKTNTVKFKLKAILGRLLAAFGNTDFQARQQKAMLKPVEDLKTILTDPEVFAWLEKFISEKVLDDSIKQGVLLTTGVSEQNLKTGGQYPLYLQNMGLLPAEINDKFKETINTIVGFIHNSKSLNKDVYVGMFKNMWGDQFMPLLKDTFQGLPLNEQTILFQELIKALTPEECIDFVQANMTYDQKTALLKNAAETIFFLEEQVLEGGLSVENYHLYLDTMPTDEKKGTIKFLAHSVSGWLLDSKFTDEKIESRWGVLKNVIPPEEWKGFLRDAHELLSPYDKKKLIQRFQIGVSNGVLLAEDFNVLSSTVLSTIAGQNKDQYKQICLEFLKTIPDEQKGTFLANIYPEMVKERGGLEAFRNLAIQALGQIAGQNMGQYKKTCIDILKTIPGGEWDTFLEELYQDSLSDATVQKFIQDLKIDALRQIGFQSFEYPRKCIELLRTMPAEDQETFLKQLYEQKDASFIEILKILAQNTKQDQGGWLNKLKAIPKTNGLLEKIKPIYVEVLKTISGGDWDTFLEELYPDVKDQNSIQALKKEALRQIAGQNMGQYKQKGIELLKTIPDEQKGTFLADIYPDMVKNGAQKLFQELAKEALGQIAGQNMGQYKKTCIDILKTIPGGDWDTFLATIYPDMVKENGDSEAFRKLAIEALGQIAADKQDKQYTNCCINVLKTISGGDWDTFLEELYPDAKDQNSIQALKKEALRQIAGQNMGQYKQKGIELLNTMLAEEKGTFLATIYPDMVKEKGGSEAFRKLAIEALKSIPNNRQSFNLIRREVLKTIPIREWAPFLKELYPNYSSNIEGKKFIQDLKIAALRQIAGQNKDQYKQICLELLTTTPAEERGTFLATIYPDMVKEKGGSEAFRKFAIEALRQIAGQNMGQYKQICLELLTTMPAEEKGTFLATIYPDMEKKSEAFQELAIEALQSIINTQTFYQINRDRLKDIPIGNWNMFFKNSPASKDGDVQKFLQALIKAKD